MAEVLVEFSDVVLSGGGRRYTARACGAPVPSGQWRGWIEFLDVESGEAIRSGRETTQPNRADTLYWATGLTAVYLDGALDRALHPAGHRAVAMDITPAFDAPAPHHPTAAGDPPVPDSVLNPFSVYRKGEPLLRRQLAALSAWHLVNIVRDHALSDQPAAALNTMTAAQLIELIVAAVRHRTDEPVGR